MLRYIDSAVDSSDNELLTIDGRDMYQEIQRQTEQDVQEVLPSTKGVQYPQDSAPAGSFGDGVEPTQLPMMRQQYMQSPAGGITKLPNFEEGPDQGPSTPIDWYPQTEQQENKGFYGPGKADASGENLPGKLGSEVAQTAGLVDGLKDLGLGARDKILDLADRPFHEELFIKAHTGGVGGDGVLRELPDRILRAIKTRVKYDTKSREWDKEKGFDEAVARAKQVIENPETAEFPYQVQAAQVFLDNLDGQKAQAEDTGRKTQGQLSLYNSGNKEAHLGLGTIGVYFDKNGNVTIKDNWKVDGSERGRPTKEDGTPMRYADLAEGGDIASDVHDLAKQLGTYKDIPIEIKLTKEQWDAIQAD